MKLLISILCLMFPFAELLAQNAHDETLIGQRVWRVPPLPMEGEQIVYKDAVMLKGVSGNTLFERAMNWLKYNMNTDDQSIKPSKAEGRITGEGKITYNQKVSASNALQRIYFDYDIRVSDGGYSYEISNLHGGLPGNRLDYTLMYREELNNIDKAGRWTHKYRYEMLSDLHSFVTLMVQGLKNAMIKDKDN